MVQRSGGLDPGVAEQIYSVLVRHAGAHEGERESFVHHQTKGFESEWRFRGLLGFGGKFRRDERGRWYVDCYREDLTEAQQRIIDRTNRALTHLQIETLEEQNSSMVRASEDIGMAWHDVTCPEAEECPDRHLHAMGQPLYSSGVLHRFVEKLGVQS